MAVAAPVYHAGEEGKDFDFSCFEKAVGMFNAQKNVDGKIIIKGGDMICITKDVYNALQENWHEYQTCFANILEESKVPRDIIKKINSANDAEKFCSAIIYTYTADGVYSQVNKALRTFDPKKSLNGQLMVLAFALFLQAVLLYWKSLPKVTTTTYRGMNLSVSDFESFHMGQKFTFLGFTSSSLSEETASEFAMDNTAGKVAFIFIFDNSTQSIMSPRDISAHSKYQHEEEAIYPSCAAFQVTKIEKACTPAKIYVKLLPRNMEIK